MSIPFPGFVTTVNTNDLLDPAWGDAIRDRAFQVFDTTANRDAAIPSPQVGQVGVITTGTNAGVYEYSGATVGWTPPWNTGWGEVGRATVTSATTGVTGFADITGLSVTWTAVASRLYRTEVKCRVESSNAGDAILVTICNTSNTILSEMDTVAIGTNLSQPHYVMYEAAASAGSNTLKARLGRTGSGVAKMNATSTFVAYMTVDDVGPAGAPS